MLPNAKQYKNLARLVYIHVYICFVSFNKYIIFMLNIDMHALAPFNHNSVENSAEFTENLRQQISPAAVPTAPPS